MNQDISYQNREISEPNPLAPVKEPDLPLDNTPKKPLDLRIKLLIILGSIIVLLLIASVIVSVVRNTSKTAPTVEPTITPSLEPSPTIVTSIIPTEFQEKFTQIDQYNQSTVNFNPPQVDTTIGQ